MMQFRRIETVHVSRAVAAGTHRPQAANRAGDVMSAAIWEERQMIVLGIILLLIGYFTHLSILYTIGGILVVIGVVLWILGAVGRPVGGRKVWF
jgi:hypothetical protein